MAQVAQMTKKDVGYMLATVTFNWPLHTEVRPYMLRNSVREPNRLQFSNSYTMH